MPNELLLIHDTIVACEGSVRELGEALVKLCALRLRAAPGLRSSHRFARPRKLKTGLAGTAQIAQKYRFARRMPNRHPESPGRFPQSGSSSRNPARRNVLWFLDLVQTDVTRHISCVFIHLLKNGGYIRYLFAYNVSMFHCPTSGIHPFDVICKGCQQNIPAPIQRLPDSWVIADCPTCGEKRRYLLADIFKGRLSHDLLMKPPQISDRR